MNNFNFSILVLPRLIQLTNYVSHFSSFSLYLSQPLSASLSLSIGISHWASRTERCLFLASCWLHPPERLSCFVEMQDTWLELAWQCCRGRCASSITTPLLHSGKWWWPKKAQCFHLKVPWAVIWIITSSQLTCYFDFFICCANTSQGMSVYQIHKCDSLFLKLLTFPFPQRFALCFLFSHLEGRIWHDSPRFAPAELRGSAPNPPAHNYLTPSFDEARNSVRQRPRNI